MTYKEDDLRFQLMFAMWLLGPQDWPPPRHVYDALRRAVRDHVPAGKVQERVLDAVIAFGCGWRRKIEEGASGWDARWPEALRSLTAMVNRAMKSANFKLRRSVGLGGSDDFNFKKKGSAGAVAYHLAMQLARPLKKHCLPEGQLVLIAANENAIEVGQDVEVPPGGKHVIDVGEPGVLLEIKGEKHMLGLDARLVIACCDSRAEIRLYPEKKTFRLEPGENAVLLPQGEQSQVFVRECTCGSASCAERHRIESWNPEFSLRAFAAAAIKGVKPGGGSTPPGLVSLQQGMYFQYLNRVIEVPLGRRQNRVNLRLRLVSVAAKQCTCGSEVLEDSCPECGEKFGPARIKIVKKSEFLENSCPACGAKFDPERMKIVKKKAFLILEGIAPEDQTQLERVGKSFVRKGFLRCNRKDADGKRVCDNHFELSDELLIKQAMCDKCPTDLFREEELKKLFSKGTTWLRRLRKLQRKRRQLISKGAACPECGAEVREIPLCCPLCGSCKLGQNLVFLYERRSPALVNMHQEAASEDDPEPGNEENSEPEDEYPGEVEDDS